MIKAHQTALETYGPVNFLMVEYPRLPTGHQIMETTLTAYDFVNSHLRVESKDITVFGKSLGGFAAVKLSQERTIGCLIVDRSGTSIMKTAEKSSPNLFKSLVRKLLKKDGWDQFDSAKALSDYNDKAYVIYHEKDQRFKNKLNLGNADLQNSNVKKLKLESASDQKDYHSHRLRKGSLPSLSGKGQINAENLWLELAFKTKAMR